jgi:hypothetical protein
MGAFFVLLFTACIYAFAGCPDPEKGVTHPDLGKVLRELEGDYGDAAVKVVSPPSRAPEQGVQPGKGTRFKQSLPRRSYRDEIGGGST